MPFVHDTPPADLVEHTYAGLASMRSRIQLPPHPVSVYVLSGGECEPDALAAADRGLWRYYDSRGNGRHVDMDVGTPPTINMVTEQGEFGILVRERLASIEKNARRVQQVVAARIIEIPALGEIAIWELRDGASHSFHATHYANKAFEEEAPEAFHGRIAKAWARMIDQHSKSRNPERLGG